MRKLSELYTLLLEHYLELLEFDCITLKFICNAIDNLNDIALINDDEHLKMVQHFNYQRPTSELHSEFLIDGLSMGKTPSEPFWRLNSSHYTEGIETRQKFIKKLIEITTADNI